MAKMGRPKTEDPRTNKISVRLTDEEHKVLIEYAERNSMSKTDAFKQGLQLLYASEERK